jgi:AbrB family looped-hinge helix DNA binding protein
MEQWRMACCSVICDSATVNSESGMDGPARLSSKGQMTVPKVVRDALGLVEGDRVVFRLEGQRAILARTPSLLVSPAACRFRRRSVVRRGRRWGDVRAPRGLTVAGERLSRYEHLIRHLTGDPPGLARRASVPASAWLASPQCSCSRRRTPPRRVRGGVG